MTSKSHGSARRGRRIGSLLAAVVIGLLAVGSMQAPPAAQALDLDLPTWDDVQKAKNDEKKAGKKITEIESLIAQVEVQVAETQRASADATSKFLETEADLMRAEEQVQAFEEQAAKSAEEADAAAEQAASIVSQMYRSGGVDRNLEMFLESDDEAADVLLERLAQMEKATERNTIISDNAEQAMNSAASLGKQAEEARVERDRLRDAADAERIVAAEAAESMRQQLVEQESQQRVLTEQLAALKDTTTETVDGYEERLVLEEAERQRILEEARKAEAARKAEEARRAAEWAKQQEEQQQNPGNSNPGGGSSGGGTTGGGGGGSAPPPVAPPASAGWVRPLAGGYWVSTEMGGYWGHTGIDLAIGSWTPIYAASSGTVIASAYFGDYDYGYGVFIDHHNGVTTRYAHMVQAPNVGYGQWVAAGQVIGYVGSTGNSTGPHLHFETRVNGIAMNPREVMGWYGIYF